MALDQWPEGLEPLDPELVKLGLEEKARILDIDLTCEKEAHNDALELLKREYRYLVLRAEEIADFLRKAGVSVRADE